MTEDVNLFAQQEANRRRSTWLVVGFIIFFAWVGFGGDIAFGLLTADAEPGAYRHVVPVIGIVTTLTAAGICWYAWRYGADRVLWATGAWEIVEPATPEQKQLVNVVEEMAIASGLPKPRVWVVPDEDPNAFLIPISLVRCMVMNDANPNNPRQATKMASMVNMLKISPKRLSPSYCRLKN